ncbi:MAG: rhodanese-like domain-containing protein [Candidatus Eremiobacteraeota bacterium]|nr:rhodanese-like domain-containing protein [Candidatus Eremiobacteraeota bacterium]
MPVDFIEPHGVKPNIPVIDIRHHRHGEQIRGALRYDPRKLLEANRLMLPLPKGGSVVLCADDEATAESVAARLRQNGYGEAFLLRGGVEDWKTHGLPTEPPTQEQPVPGEEGAGIDLL